MGSAWLHCAHQQGASLLVNPHSRNMQQQQDMQPAGTLEAIAAFYSQRAHRQPAVPLALS